MPAPPPPSKSYLLVLDDTSSDEEEEDHDYYRRQKEQHEQVKKQQEQLRLQQQQQEKEKNESSRVMKELSSPTPSSPVSRIVQTSEQQQQHPQDTTLRIRESAPPPALVSPPNTPPRIIKQQQGALLEEKKEEQEPQERMEEDSNSSLFTTSPTTVIMHQNDAHPHAPEEALHIENGKPLSKSQKRNRRRQKQKQTPTSTTTSEDGVPEAATTLPSKTKNKTSQRKVSFSTVTTQVYPRAFSGVAIPADGGWPLGMELKPLEVQESAEEGDSIAPIVEQLEDYETSKQCRLQERMTEVLQHATTAPSDINGDATPSAQQKSLTLLQKQQKKSPQLPLETRQWDYYTKVRNPLFGVLSEERRQVLFLEASSSSGTTLDDSEKSLMSDHSNNHSGQHPSSPPRQKLRRSRANSCAEAPPSPPTSSRHNGRSRSNSYAESSNSSNHNNKRRNHHRSSPSHHSEQFNDTYNQVYVHHVRNELEQIRTDRSHMLGCHCRKLNVYLPPKDGSGGKKSQHRRLKPSKLTLELKKRNLYDPSASREALEKILHKAVAQEPCCQEEDRDCFCIRNGIVCQSDACSCWLDSHGHITSTTQPATATTTKSDLMEVSELKRRCGNPLGMITVDLDVIDSFRQGILLKGCQPCS